jgi:hypothetical protein
MGALPERWRGLSDLRSSLRLPIGLLLAVSLWFGFFPQSVSRLITPVFKSYFAPPTP